MKRQIKIVAIITITLTLIAVLGAGWSIRSSAKGRIYSDVSLIPHRKVGVILGCSQRISDGRANLFFLYRIAAAAQLFNARKVDYFIVSGDNHVVGYDESTDMKSALVVVRLLLVAGKREKNRRCGVRLPHSRGEGKRGEL